eukprot:1155620-Pelagomonas_calceolata.AAC.1
MQFGLAQKADFCCYLCHPLHQQLQLAKFAKPSNKGSQALKEAPKAVWISREQQKQSGVEGSAQGSQASKGASKVVRR